MVGRRASSSLFEATDSLQRIFGWRDGLIELPEATLKVTGLTLEHTA